MVLEVPAPVDGVLAEILQETGATVISQQVLGKISTQQAGDIIETSAKPDV